MIYYSESALGRVRWTLVIRSPKLSAIPCVLERIRIYPVNLQSPPVVPTEEGPASTFFFSIETLTKASSPKTL